MPLLERLGRPLVLPLGCGPTFVPLLEGAVRVVKPLETGAVPALEPDAGGVLIPVPGTDGRVLEPDAGGVLTPVPGTDGLVLAPCDGVEDPGRVFGTLDEGMMEFERVPLWLVEGTTPVAGGFVPVPTPPGPEPPPGVG